MTAYTRVTVLGAGRRVEVVIPDAEPVAAMLPDILGLLEHAPGPVVLTTRFGDQLDAALSLAEQEVVDGTPLWVTPLSQAPPPPQVVDITEMTAGQHATQTDAWRPIWTIATASLVVAVLSWLATYTVKVEITAAIMAMLTIAACVFGRRGRVAIAVMCAAAACGAALSLGVILQTGPPAFVALTCFALLCLIVGTVGIGGFGDRALGVAGLVGTVQVLAVTGLVQIGVSQEQAASIAAVLGVAILSLAPGIAMTTSGLAGLDDRLVDGGEAMRSAASRTIDTAYRSLTWTVIVCTVVVGICGIIVAGATPWGRLLALAFAIILALRIRVFPSAMARLALAAAATAIAITLLMGVPTNSILVVCAATGALGIAAFSTLHPTPVVMARLHRLSDFIEAISVVSLVPLALAQWGVFADLIGAFR